MGACTRVHGVRRVTLAVSLSASLALGLLPGIGVAWAADSAPVAGDTVSKKGPGDARQFSEQEAAAAAERTGKNVEIASLRSESGEVFATPEGDLEAREYLRPVRARVGGEWKPVDTDLVQTSDGAVAPGATTVGLEFSGGGDGPLVRMAKAGRELSLSWPGGLPAPELDGETATYRNACADLTTSSCVKPSACAPMRRSTSGSA